MNLSEAQEAVAQGYGKMADCWERTGQVWRDAARMNFQRDHWEPMEPVVRRALTALGELDEEITQLYRELTD